MSLKSVLAYPFACFVKLRNDRWIKNPLKFQKKTFHKLIEKAKTTTFGIDHSFENIKTYEDWKKNVPIRGPHLHFELWKGSSAVNPVNYILF